MATSTKGKRKRSTQSPSPSTRNGGAKFEQAKELIASMLQGKEWVPSKEIHEKLADKVSDGMFGKVKAAMNIQHRRITNGNGRPQYEWKLPKRRGRPPKVHA